MAKLLGIPWENPNWKPGVAWFDDPEIFRIFSRIASVMQYVELEFGIEDGHERDQLHQFLHHLHSEFCHRLELGEELASISFSPEILED